MVGIIEGLRAGNGVDIFQLFIPAGRFIAAELIVSFDWTHFFLANKTGFYLRINDTKKPGFSGPGSAVSRDLRRIISAARKREKHGRAGSAGHDRAGAGKAGAGNWGGVDAWIEWVSG
ncbi:hypothetical protein ACFQ48_15475 [Hymenobacter caeli]|uniref:Uncharacterized protein n=1 Tax=Hymenobacter caeli TaxID=2735894 RepID=A0ABX2FQS6_9BACT|nr:hypothetical protein [Hymenobacter caeli]NRT19469.1 hypothetical protein [Hymenobacter caeli]